MRTTLKDHFLLFAGHFVILIMALSFLPTAGHAQQTIQPPLTTTPASGKQTPDQIRKARELLSQPPATPTPLNPVELRREGPTTLKDVPGDFIEHRPVSLPENARLALAKSASWSNATLVLPERGKDGRVIYTYGASMPVVVCSPFRVCVIELEGGEQFSGAPHLGDNVRWDLSVETSGAGEIAHPLIVVKPKDTDLDTALFVATNRRSYYIRLISNPDAYIPIISFDYPEEQQAALARQIAAQQTHTKLISDTQVTPITVPVDGIFYDYSIKGHAPFRPVRVMDDGVKTYIQMPPETAHRELPTLAVDGPEGRELVNFRVKGQYFIVDRLFDKALLLLGAGKHTQKIEITRQTPHQVKVAQAAEGGN